MFVHVFDHDNCAINHGPNGDGDAAQRHDVGVESVPHRQAAYYLLHIESRELDMMAEMIASLSRVAGTASGVPGTPQAPTCSSRTSLAHTAGRLQ